MNLNKCLHITHTDPRTDSRILKEMEVLAKNNSEVLAIGIEPRECLTRLSSVDSHISFRNIKLASRNLNFLPRILRHICSYVELTLKILFLDLKFKPNVIHCHDFLMLPCAVWLKNFFDCRLIYDAHELESHKNNINFIQGKIIFFIEKLLWKYIDALIVVSPSIDNWYKNNFGEKTSVVILNSPLYTQTAVYDDDYLRRYFKINDDEKIFIYVGMLMRGRGLELITKVFNHPEICSHLVLLGFGELQSDLEKLSIDQPNVHFHQVVPHDEVVPITKSANYGICLIENVSLSDFYCLPNKLFEYLFSGLPVLASNFPDIANLLKAVDGGFCCDLNEEKVTEAVLFMQNEKKSYQMQNIDSYCWERQGEKLLDLYHQISVTE